MSPAPDRAAPDPLSRVLELGLAAFLLIVPLPFGSVTPGGRLTLEIAALSLGLIWVMRAARHPTPLPSRASLVGLVGLLALACVQLVPLGEGIVGTISPETMKVRHAMVPPDDALEAESSLLGLDPTSFEGPPSLSVDPAATASALRTGCAFAIVFLVATTVAATRGVRTLALALLVSGSFQGLYGLLVLASGHDQIWNVPKKYFIDCATGTFVNRNHFGGYLAMALSCGAALILANAERRRTTSGRRALLVALGAEGSRNLVLVLLLLTGLAGLLTSFSRAGIALGVVALVVTIIGATRTRSMRKGVAVAGLVLAVAAVPLLYLGSERLLDRYSNTVEWIITPGGRGTVWMDTLGMAAAYPVTGSGYGTFSTAYPMYRSKEVGKFWTHAHHDLVQATAEGGGLGLVWLGIFLAGVLGGVLGGLTGRKGTLGVGFAAGLTAILLHALVDFNFHIPANAATAAILAGALQGMPWTRPR